MQAAQPAHQTFYVMLVQCWPTVCDADPTLHQHQARVFLTINVFGKEGSTNYSCVSLLRPTILVGKYDLDLLHEHFERPAKNMSSGWSPYFTSPAAVSTTGYCLAAEVNRQHSECVCSLYIHTPRVLPIHFDRETIPSGFNHPSLQIFLPISIYLE